MWFSLSTESRRDLSLREQALSATLFVPFIAAHGAFGEPAPLDACASERRLTVCGGVSCGLSITWGQTQVLGLALRGMAPVGHMNTRDAAEQRWLTLLVVRALARRALPTAEALSMAWFDRRVQFSHAASLDRAVANDGH